RGPRLRLRRGFAHCPAKTTSRAFKTPSKNSPTSSNAPPPPRPKRAAGARPAASRMPRPEPRSARRLPRSTPPPPPSPPAPPRPRAGRGGGGSRKTGRAVAGGEPQSGGPPPLDPQLARIAEAVVAERLEVLIEPIHVLSEGRPRHYEVTMRLRTADGEQLE